MRFIKAILSADLNWGIGFGGKLLQRVPEDMKYFMNMTLGKVVVMGRETFDSLPGRRPLKDRVNIILSRTGIFDDESLIVCRTIDELFRELGKYPSDDIFVIGGESIYTQLLPFCSEVYVTRFEKTFEADRHFPDLNVLKNWVLASESEEHFFKEMGFRFLKYINTDTADFME